MRVSAPLSEGVEMAKQQLRYAFTIRDGVNAFKTRGPWKISVNREDIYITAAEFAGTWKVSLHGDEAWRIALQKENYLSASPLLPRGTDLAVWRFPPTPFVNGRRKAFAIMAMWSALLSRPRRQKDVHIEVDDRWDIATVAYVWMTVPGVDLNEPRIVGEPLTLGSGRRVWLTARVEDVPGGVPEAEADGVLAEPRLPEQHGTSCAGYLLRGLFVGSI